MREPHAFSALLLLLVRIGGIDETHAAPSVACKTDASQLGAFGTMFLIDYSHSAFAPGAPRRSAVSPSSRRDETWTHDLDTSFGDPVDYPA